MNKNIHKLIVVLGMHRSGTSAITRGLQVMGVNLGNALLPPQEDNIAGFWEDMDINALNIEMLNSLNSDWHFLTPIQQSDIDVLYKNGYLQRAIKMLQSKTAGVDVFGLKDPRTAKLLPFWKEVFTQCQLKVSYVLAIRHPLSVCKSLEKRHGFDFEKSSLLWLEHVLNSLVGTDGEKCVLVDYDRLVSSPEFELQRIANGLQFQIDLSELDRFKAEFLNRELRHTVFSLDELMLENSMLPLVREVYSELLNVAAGNIQLSDASLRSKIAQWRNELARLTPTLVFIDKLNSKIKTIIVERESQTSSLNEQIVEQDRQIEALTTQLYEITASKAWQAAMLLRRMSNILRFRSN